MKVAIHQPQFLPWPGYLDKAASCDTFVYLDNVQYQKRGLQNRNTLKGATGPFWLTVPVHAKRADLIKDVVVVGEEWILTHCRALESCYRRAPGFNRFYPPLTEALRSGSQSLCDLNILLTEMMFEWFGINCKRIRASALNVSGAKEELIVDICRACEATAYISGIGAKNYQNRLSFQKHGIDLIYRTYEPVEYRQRFSDLGFIPGVSAVDLIMNEPDKAHVILEQSGHYIAEML